MKKRASQFALVIAAMAMVGSVYGWSTTAAVLGESPASSAKQAVSAFGMFAAGIGAGVVISGVLLPALGYAKTIAAGLVTWGLALFVFSQFGLSGGSRILLVTLAVVTGAGVGVAYLALVSFFRTLFARSTVISGLIGPLGFASGGAIISLAQAIRPSIDTVAHVYRAFGIGALALGVTVLFFLVESPVVGTAAERTNASDWRPDLLYLWALLSLNVVPGMAIIAIAVPWFGNTRPWSFGEAALALCAALLSLPLGQTVWGIAADRRRSRGLSSDVLYPSFSVRRCFHLAATCLALVSLVCLSRVSRRRVWAAPQNGC
jgi:hypothetical protein